MIDRFTDIKSGGEILNIERKYEKEILKILDIVQEQENQINYSELDSMIASQDISTVSDYLSNQGIDVIMEDVEPERNDPIVIPFETAKIDISMSTITIDALVKRIKYQELDFDSDFQRKSGLWNDEAKSRLIESILLRIPLPAFYFDAAKDDFWTIIDGLQRITVLKEFVVENSLALKNMEFLQDLNKKKFTELPRSMQRRIEETNVIAYIVNPGTPSDVKFNIFKRINTGGLVLTPQEIRNALYQGEATKFIKLLSEKQIFKDVTGGSIRSERMLDREFCLRFVGITQMDIEKYKGVEEFLNRGMDFLNKTTLEERKQIERSFEYVMEVAGQIFGHHAFRKMAPDDRRRPINKAIFEIWSYHLNRLDKQQTDMLIQCNDKVQERFIRLCEDPSFLRDIKSSDHISVNRRIKAVKELIKELNIDD